jgi:hypothetical protein
MSKSIANWNLYIKKDNQPFNERAKDCIRYIRMTKYLISRHRFKRALCILSGADILEQYSNRTLTKNRTLGKRHYIDAEKCGSNQISSQIKEMNTTLKQLFTTLNGINSKIDSLQKQISDRTTQ